jgi:hypothetical protein
MSAAVEYRAPRRDSHTEFLPLAVGLVEDKPAWLSGGTLPMFPFCGARVIWLGVRPSALVLIPHSLQAYRIYCSRTQSYERDFIDANAKQSTYQCVRDAVVLIIRAHQRCDVEKQRVFAPQAQSVAAKTALKRHLYLLLRV